jgi:PKD repeat protein
MKKIEKFLLSNNLKLINMKKILLIIGLLVSVNLMYGQTTYATLSLPNVPVTAAGEISIPITLDYCSPGDLIVGIQISFYYSETYVHWMGTSANPAPGVSYINPALTPLGGDWLWNANNPGNLIFSWIDPTYNGVTVPAPGDFIRFRFNYLGGLPAGGSTPLTYSLAMQLSNGQMVKIINELTNQYFDVYQLTLLNGSVYNNTVLAPVADFSGTPTSGTEPLNVNFTDMSTNTPTSWAWDFGDGSPIDNTQNPSHTYAAGTWTVSLTATNAGGFNTMTKTGYIVVSPSGPITKTWSGLGDGTNWFDPNNWSPVGVPTSEDVVINAAKAPMVVISGGTATTGTLTVAFGAGINIASDGALTTNGLYTNNGQLIISSDNSLGYAGSYIDNGGIAGTGTFEFDRYVICSGTTGYSTNPFGWHYLAAPFDGFTSDGIFDYYSNKWDQATGTWTHMEMPTPPNPLCTPWPTEPLSVLNAWSVNYASDYACGWANPGTGAQVEFMSGAAGVHTGNYGKALGFGGGLYQNWNMVSNPYPSGLDVNTIAWGANTVAATYYYDGCAGNYVYWATGLGSYVMTPTLGFMVETTGADVFNVGNASRSHNADWFWKNDVANLLTLQATGTGGSDVLKVRFANDVTAGFDNNGDAHKLFAETENLPQIYTLAGTEKLAINALPETQLVHMGFVANGSGEYTIEAIETSEFANVVLEDCANGIQTDLLSGSYTFNYAEGAEHAFIIHFTPLGTPEYDANSINIWAANQTIYVQAPATTGDIVVYNMMGQEVVKTAIQPGLNVIPMEDVNTYYIVKVLGSEITETGKVFIK